MRDHVDRIQRLQIGTVVEVAFCGWLQSAFRFDHCPGEGTLELAQTTGGLVVVGMFRCTYASESITGVIGVRSPNCRSDGHDGGGSPATYFDGLSLNPP
jgi:hypothetical protein